MSDSKPEPNKPMTPSSCLGPARSGRRLRHFGLAMGMLALGFAMPLSQLVNVAFHSDFHSYILLIPFISLYLAGLKRSTLPVNCQPDVKAAAALMAAGIAVLLVYWLFLRSRWSLMEDDYLAMMMISFALLVAGICGLFLGKEMLRANAFPLGLLIFMAPIPAVAMPPIDAFLQHGSAAVAAGFFNLAGTPYLRSGLVFLLPGIQPLQVARECSGIQSSMVLLITGLVAGHLFLRKPWSRVTLALLMVPLGLLRNGFRIFTIGELCVHISPRMIDSPIHHRGGPIFFALSLIPLFVLLILLKKIERAPAKSGLGAEEISSPKPVEKL